MLNNQHILLQNEHFYVIFFSGNFPVFLTFFLFSLQFFSVYFPLILSLLSLLYFLSFPLHYFFLLSSFTYLFLFLTLNFHFHPPFTIFLPFLLIFLFLLVQYETDISKIDKKKKNLLIKTHKKWHTLKYHPVQTSLNYY